jgi:hypothetical protein
MTPTPPPDAHKLPDTSATDEALCEPCAGIQRNWRGTKGHAELIQGTHRTVAHKHGAVTITRYRCERCGTIWEYENNKVNREAGWSIPRRR